MVSTKSLCLHTENGNFCSHCCLGAGGWSRVSEREEGKDFRDPNVRPDGQVNVKSFKGKEVWVGSGVCGLKIL